MIIDIYCVGINPLTGVVDSVEDITDHATHSMSYVLGIEQGE